MVEFRDCVPAEGLSISPACIGFRNLSSMGSLDSGCQCFRVVGWDYEGTIEKPNCFRQASDVAYQSWSPTSQGFQG